MSSRPWLLVWGWGLVACGSPPPAAFVRENESARAAQRSGEHASAARHYERAASVAKNARDAEEMRYRAADSRARAGEWSPAEALFRGLAAQGPDAERRARADFALAELWAKQGREADAQAHLVAAIRRHPNSGLARQALREHLAYLRGRGGSAEALAYLTSEERALSGSELAEALSYHRARELDVAGKLAEARDAYLECARRFPYPKGAYWDDALFRAAEKELELGSPHRAVVHLRRMLDEQESATFTGSYERGRYAQAQLTLGQIYRDRLHDPARARAELRKVWQNHSRSALVDDALFQEALVARAQGDAPGACAALSIIVSKRPDSRFAPCAHLLCPRLTEMGSACHDYVKRAAGLPGPSGAER